MLQQTLSRAVSELTTLPRNKHGPSACHPRCTTHAAPGSKRREAAVCLSLALAVVSRGLVIVTVQARRPLSSLDFAWQAPAVDNSATNRCPYSTLKGSDAGRPARRWCLCRSISTNRGLGMLSRLVKSQ